MLLEEMVRANVTVRDPEGIRKRCFGGHLALESGKGAFRDLARGQFDPVTPAIRRPVYEGQGGGARFPHFSCLDKDPPWRVTYEA